jgi:hypothetical protein
VCLQAKKAAAVAKEVEALLVKVESDDEENEGPRRPVTRFRGVPKKPVASSPISYLDYDNNQNDDLSDADDESDDEKEKERKRQFEIMQHRVCIFF